MNTPQQTVLAVAKDRGTSLTSRRLAEELDHRDPLSQLPRLFRKPLPLSDGTPASYLCGANMGLQHRDVTSELVGYTSHWADHGCECLIREPKPFYYYDDLLLDDLAKIVGAKKSEVVLMNGLTVNIHFLFAAFFKPQLGARTKILCERGPFPSDKHALISQLESHGLSPKEHLVEISEGGQTEPHVISTETIIAAIEQHKDSAAILWLPAVQFQTGQFFEVGRITAAARKHGILVGIDAAHAVGNVPLHFHDWDVDFGVWCSYKYLSSGPGGIAGAFVHERHLTPNPADGLPAIRANFKGWWGNNRATRFQIRDTFDYAPGAAALPVSNPSIVSIVSLIPSIRLIGGTGMDALRQKSILLTGYLEMLIDHYFTGISLDVVSPRDWRQRGACLTLSIRADGLTDAAAKMDASCLGGKVKAFAMARNVYIDYRPPNILRISPAGTFSTFQDVFACIEVLRGALRQRLTADEACAKPLAKL